MRPTAVMPICTVDRKRPGSAASASALLAPRRPSCARDLSRDRREETTASSDRQTSHLEQSEPTPRHFQTCVVFDPIWLSAPFGLCQVGEFYARCAREGNDCFTSFPAERLPDRRRSRNPNRVGTAELEMSVGHARRAAAACFWARLANHRFAFMDRSVIQTGAWSLAPSWPRTERSTRASCRRDAMSGLRRRWSSLSPASRCQRLRK
jgi:hypothetical protein